MRKETELRFLSALLNDPSQLEAIDVSPDDLSDRHYAEILSVLLKMRAENIPPTLHTIQRRIVDRMRNPAPEAEAAVRAMLEEIASMRITDAASEAKLIQTDARAHRLYDAGMQIQALAINESYSSIEKIAKAEELMSALSQTGQVSDREARTLADVGRAVLARMDAAAENQGLTGYETGIAELDAMIGGFFPGDITIIAGRPAMGKTALAIERAEDLSARMGALSYVATMEMIAEAIGERMLAGASGIPVLNQRRGVFTPQQRAAAEQWVNGLEGIPMWIDDRSSWTIPQLRAHCIRHQRQHGLNLLLLDYFSLMTASRDKIGVQALDELARGLKAIAKDLGIHILLVAQLNRDCEKREDKRPIKADLRETGQLEQDATNIIFVHRPVIYNPEHEFPDLAELIVAKSRNGETGTINMRFDGGRSSFSPWTGPNPAASNPMSNKYSRFAGGARDPFGSND